MTANQPDEHDDAGGLHRDLTGLVGRRRALQLIGGIGLAGLVAACASDDAATRSSGDSTAGTTATTSSVATTSSDTAEGEADADGVSADEVVADAGPEIADETAGPFPADGSNGPNVLGEQGVDRSDITTSIGSMSGTADGTPTRFQFTVVDAGSGAPLPGAAVYLWHCTADGRYSIYDIADQNYLRGVQTADDAGRVSFDSIFPGCYAGRWPHCHFEIYTSIDDATAGNLAIKTSQLALPQADCEAIYLDTTYGASTQNLARLSLTSDNVFNDGWEDQLATVAASGDGGYTASLLVRV
jgi:protocatechuate 3,4-dioxygenase beta subunit